MARANQSGDSTGSDFTEQPARCPRQAPLDFRSKHLAVALSRNHIGFDFLSVDSLGGGAVEESGMLSIEDTPARVWLEQKDGRFNYHPLFQTDSTAPLWTVKFTEKSITLRSEYHRRPPLPEWIRRPVDFRLVFRREACPATLLGLMDPDAKTKWLPEMSLPCVLHLPNMGSMRIRCSVPGIKLGYDAKKGGQVQLPMVPFTHVVFPFATQEHPVVEYTLEVAALYPQLPGIEKDRRFDVFRRNYLNSFQVSPEARALGCVDATNGPIFNLFMVAEAAAPNVQLVDNLQLSDLMRMTIDRALFGLRESCRAGSGFADFPYKYDMLDLDPAYIIAAALYVRSTGDLAWAEARYVEVMKLIHQMMSTDTNGNGLIKFGESGNHGNFENKYYNTGSAGDVHACNWWDVINFGHEDAYCNALAYAALQGWREVAEKTGFPEDALWLGQKAAKLKKAYQEVFLNPETGVFAGWRSADGELHDYWFLFLNSVAIVYGLAEDGLANDIMDKLLAKMKEVGFDNFRAGLPGNLVPVIRADYANMDRRDPEIATKIFGYPQSEDGSDGFQHYENGGASTRYVYYTLKALYKLHRFDEARRMLYPLLESYEAREHDGVDVSGNSRDWTTWDGKTACGYEGFAVGNFFPLAAVVDEWESQAKDQMAFGEGIRGR